MRGHSSDGESRGTAELSEVPDTLRGQCWWGCLMGRPWDVRKQGEGGTTPMLFSQVMGGGVALSSTETGGLWAE